MSEITITAAIKSIIEGLDINNVHDYERWTKDKTKFHETFKDKDKIYGWEISVPEINFIESVNPRSTKWLTEFEYEITGWLSLNDQLATEKTMRSAAFLILSTLLEGNADERNTIVPTQTKPLEKPRIRLDHQMFGDVLCHRARITFTITEITCVDNVTEYGDMYYIGLSYSWPEHDDREYDSRHVPRPGEDAYDIDPETDQVDDLIILEES